MGGSMSGESMKYRKKPVVIEAIQWTGENLREIIAFIGLHPSALKWTWEEYEKVVKAEGLKIFTLEGPHMATVGDFIIKGIKGEAYPCKPDIFAATYESADAPPPAPAEKRWRCSGCDRSMDSAYQQVWAGGTANHWDAVIQKWCGPVVEVTAEGKRE
jgi:hypothetical protein